MNISKNIPLVYFPVPLQNTHVYWHMLHRYCICHDKTTKLTEFQIQCLELKIVAIVICIATNNPIYVFDKPLLSVPQETFVFRGDGERVCRLLHFLLLIAQQPMSGFSSNLADVNNAVALGKICEYGVMTFQPIREVT